MAEYTSQWEQLLDISKRVSRSDVKSGGLYKITVYTKEGSKTKNKTRYIFVIGIDGENIHSLKLNNINPLDFSNFIYAIRNKQKKIDNSKPLREHLIKFSRKGENIFKNYIKPNKRIYGGDVGSYRIYKDSRISYISEVVFEKDIMEQLLSPTAKITNRRNIIDREVDLNDD